MPKPVRLPFAVSMNARYSTATLSLANMNDPRTIDIQERSMNNGSYDNGGRRIGMERRDFSYSSYFPERRIDDRRSGHDRRKMTDRRNEGNRRAAIK